MPLYLVIHSSTICSKVIQFWMVCFTREFHVCFFSVANKCLAYSTASIEWQDSCLWSKWVDPPSCKTNNFFLRSLALSVPIYRNFQSNGANLQYFKPWKQNFYIIGHYINFFIQSLKLHNLLKISINWHTKSQKDLRKNVPILQEGGRIHPCPVLT